MPGSLFVVATPIGNLEDLTFRALRVLRTVDLIAAEDTRRTAGLLQHYDVRRPLMSLHEHNEHREAPRLVSRIAAGENVALVSDAGTPAISDPGSVLVRLCREAGLAVVAVPGPSAITAALSVTGLPAVPFAFLGFPPPSGADRGRWFDQLADVQGAVVFFEAPHRMERTLADVSSSSKRPIFVHKEITKIHESLVKWNNTNICLDGNSLNRGEFVVVLGPEPENDGDEIDDGQLLAVVNHLELLNGLTEDHLWAAVAAATGLPRSKVRNRTKKARLLVKRQMDIEP